MKIIAQGAEALITKNKNTVLKERIKKSYRLPALDEALRKKRTRKEEKLLTKASAMIKVPKILRKTQTSLTLECIEGKKLSESFDKLKNKNTIAREIGTTIAKLHDANVIHGDLTTSNMILVGKNIYFIDFGLGFGSDKLEDKAVDLHLLHQALNAKHFKNARVLWEHVQKGYTKSKNAKNVLTRLQKVEARGRYKKGS